MATVIAEGERAQGHAGRMGGGPEYLLVLKQGQVVECVRGGRLYGAPIVFRLECQAGQVIMTEPGKEAEGRQAASRWEVLATTGSEVATPTLAEPQFGTQLGDLLG